MMRLRLTQTVLPEEGAKATEELKPTQTVQRGEFRGVFRGKVDDPVRLIHGYLDFRELVVHHPHLHVFAFVCALRQH